MNKDLAQQSLEVIRRDIDRLQRELEHLQQLRDNLQLEVEGKPAPSDTSFVAETTIQLDSGEPVIPRTDPQTGKRIRQRDRIVRLLELTGPLVRGEIQNMLRIPPDTLNASLSDKSLFMNDRRTHKWSLAKPVKPDPTEEEQ